MAGDDSSSALPMQERSASIAPSVSVSGFKLPMPSPNSSPAIAQTGSEEKGADAADQSNVEGQGQVAIPPSTAGGMSQQSGSVMDERDSGMFTFNRPGSRGGSDSRAYTSSYYAGGSRMNTGIGISYGSPSTDAHGRPYTGRPLTAFTIPEEFGYSAEPETMSPAAAVAAAYREGRPPPPTRGNLATPVIELDERMRTAATMETAMYSEGTSTPNQGSMKTEDLDGYSKVNPIEDMMDGLDPEDLMKLGAETEYAQGSDPAGVFEEEEDSPFPEVRASVSNYDDPDMPCLTFRALFLGTTFTMLGAALNTYFQMRYPSPFVTPYVIQVITYPFGAAMARFLPVHIYRTPPWLVRSGCPDEWSLNPGPFNIKEHAIIVIMANVGIVPAFGIHVLLALDKYYGIKTGFGFDILLLLSSQMIAFVFAGLTRRFLIWPASLIWPQSLVTCTLLNTFHAEDDDGTDGSLSRYRYFVYIFAGAALWYFIPGFLFVALSAFSWVCWIAPQNPIVNQLFGVSTGLGMSSLTFDWSQIAYIGSPLIAPWWAVVNVFAGFLVFYWLLSPILYYTNTWNTGYLPLSVNAVFDRFGSEYNITAVLTPELSLDFEAYHAYSPVYLPTTYATVYFIAFALASASLVHTAIYHGPAMVATLKDIRKAQTDIHAKLMLKYKAVPVWWFLIIFVASIAMAIGLIEGFNTGLPIWGLLVSIIIVGIYIIPGGFIFALSSQLITVNILAESIPGVLFAAKPIVNMIFKTYSVQAISAGLFFIQDLKLGHYMKIPPRTTFLVQILASVVAALAQAGMKEGLLHAVPDLCSENQQARLICPTAKSVFNASIIWGLIGPRRIFGTGSPYASILWALLAGALAPLPAWLLAKRFPRQTWLHHVNFPVMLSGASYIPPANGINYTSWFLGAFIFQYMLRRYRFRWWSRYNFVTSAALDSGTATGAIIIFLLLQLPKNGTLRPVWWGNTVYRETMDWIGYPSRIPPESGFGPTQWP